ncbi:hypothetical protein LVISKB_1080 [Levilactobacillus brevis KB290]|uniref:Uncharacterized protein n=1 Tax=Levilactobacillus brevis KB290 TaxID=1001583 RepID=M5AE80_LEVBR|nr:hypothetical protein LVISKB_1080 [Levilactobacillus brevis KB290]
MIVAITNYQSQAIIIPHYLPEVDVFDRPSLPDLRNRQ